MRCRYHIGKLRQFRCRHLIPGTADVQRRSGNAVLAQRRDQRSLIDEIATGQIDEECVRPHLRQGGLPDQILGLLIGNGETDDIIRTRQQIVERHVPDRGIADRCEGIGDQNFHAEHFCQSGKVAADAAIADDAEPAAGKLPSHPDFRHPSGMIVRGRARDAAREIDHEAERELGHRLDETRARLRHQHAGRGRRRHVDVADIDRAADEGTQLWQMRKDFARSLRQTIGDDDVDILRGIDQMRRIERVVALMQADVGHRPQTAETALAVIVAPHLRGVGQQHFQHFSPNSRAHAAMRC